MLMTLMMLKHNGVKQNMAQLKTIELERDTKEAVTRCAPEQVFSVLNTGPAGLTRKEAEKRLERFGRNAIDEVKGKPLILKFLANFTHLMALLLWAGGAMAFIGKMPQLGWAVWAVVVINAVFSFSQEYKAEKATAALRKLLPTNARVLRDGEEQLILAEELVPGDIILLSEGDHVSADARLVNEAELQADQSTLSGESHPVRKSSEATLRSDLSFVEMPNVVFAGTNIVAGTGKAVVFATGMKSQFGKIAGLTQSVGEELSPLQKEINRMTKIVTALAVGIGVLFFILSVTVVGRPLSVGFIFAVGMIVAFVPEGLLPTVTLSLAMGVQRMAKRHALVKKLSSVETLGSTTVICTDKTGTLTKNEMTVRGIWLPDRPLTVTGVGYEPSGQILDERESTLTGLLADDLREMLIAAGLCNNSKIKAPETEESRWVILGDPTEAALKVMAAKGGVDLKMEETRRPRMREIPFDSRRKRMSTIHASSDGKSPKQLGRVVYVKGAPKEVLALCTRFQQNGRECEISETFSAKVLSANDNYAREGLRVLAIARKTLGNDENDYTADAVERDLTFLGLAAMMDPPRPEVEEAVQKCHHAGIRVIMITGDYGLTAESIARRVGIVRSEHPRIITGVDLAGLEDDELKKALQGEVIFARVAPEDKLRVVRVLKERGEIVAVTGDGVNDAPALKKADIGVAMGLSGTDVAKEAASMILTDDNFASIVNAVEEGRAVYANIKKFSTYIFTSNVPEAWPFIFQILFNVPLALTVMQVLAVDLGTDLVPALALGAEPPEPGIMNQPPRGPKDRLIDRPLLLRSLLWMGSIQSLLCFAGYFLLWWSFGYHDLLHLPRVDLLPYGDRLLSRAGMVYVLSTTIFHAGVITTQIGNAFARRTERSSVFKIGLFSNRFLLIGVATELALICLLIYVQPFQTIFEEGSLPLRFWGFIALYAPIMLLVEEARKALVRAKGSNRRRAFSRVG